MNRKGYSMLVAMILIVVTAGVTSLMITGVQFFSERRSLENKVSAQAQIAAMVDRAAYDWANDNVGESSWSEGEVRSVGISDLQAEGYLPYNFAEKGTPLGPTYRSYIQKKPENEVLMVTLQEGAYTEYGFFEPSTQARRALRANIGRYYRQNFAGSTSAPTIVRPDHKARPISRKQQGEDSQARGEARAEPVDLSGLLDKVGVGARTFGVIRGFDLSGGQSLGSTTLGDKYNQLRTVLARQQLVASQQQFQVLNSKGARSADLVDDTDGKIIDLEDELTRLGDVDIYNELRNQIQTIRGQQSTIASDCTSLRRNIRSLAPNPDEVGNLTC